MKKILLIGGNGLVGKAIHNALQSGYQMVITAGHHDPEGGYRLEVKETEKLLHILNAENPDIVVSSIRGDFTEQMKFHEELADWLAGKDKRLLYISTANVFDGDLSKPCTEEDLPVPGTDYGKFKEACEEMLKERLAGQFSIFRLSMVWALECPRIKQLRECSDNGKPLPTCQGISVNITLAEQIGWYAEYVLAHDLKGIFHVGSIDTVDYHEFQKMVCKTVGIKEPEYDIEVSEGSEFQAVIPGRKEIPENLQLTVSQILEALSGSHS